MTARKGGGARASRLGALGFTAVALVLTGLTAFLLARLMGASKYATEPVRDVVVAKRDIPASQVITNDDLKVVKWPVSSVPEGAFGSIDEMLGPEPRVPVSTILEGEPILEARLASPKAGTGMASLVPPSLRAFPVPVDHWVAEARLVYPGAVVDVLTTLRNPIDRKASTKLVLQAVPVLAVDGAVDAASVASQEKRGGVSGGVADKSVVTLLVTPEQAESLALSMREGQIDLMLRNAGDKSLVETFGITPNELLGIPDPDEVEEAQEMLTADAKDKDKDDRRRRRRRPARRRRTSHDQNFPPDDRPTTIRRGGTKTIRLGGQ